MVNMKSKKLTLVLLVTLMALLAARGLWQYGLPGGFWGTPYATAQTATAFNFEYVEIDATISGDVKMVGDIDGDGFPDLIIGGMPSEKLNWYRYPDWKKTVIATPLNEFTTDAALGDMDGDGDLDIVVPDGDQGDNLVWYKNPRPSGDPLDGAQWTRHTIGATGSWGKDVKLADFDGDGRLDVATRNEWETMVFFQTVPGEWAKVVFSGFEFGHEGMGSGDINGDGFEDLVLRGVWLRNPGGMDARTPSSWTQHSIGPANSDFKALVVDLNGDGKMDVLFSSSENSADVNWWTPSSDDPTGTWVKHTILNSLEKAHTLQAADMDGDGDLDVVVGQMHTSSAKELMVMENINGEATQWAKHVIATGGLHNGVVADIGNNGKYDIFGANWTGNPPVKLWLNRTVPSRSYTYILVTSQHQQTFGLAFGDMNGDGRVDILSGRYWYANPGGTMETIWTQSAFPEGMHALLTLDVNGNSLPDVIAHKDEGDIALYWLEADGTSAQQWNAVRIGSVPRASHSLGAQGYRTAQLENSSMPQIVISSGQGILYFRIPENPGAGNWPRVHISSNPSDEGFAVGDIDRDGFADIAATTGDSKRVEWYRNPGNGSENWQAFHIGSFNEALYPDRTEVADLNNNGRLDIIVSEENGEASGAEVYWWEQPADPTQGNWDRRLVARQGTTNSMDTADINKDGYMDLILAEHRGDRRLSLWLNKGSLPGGTAGEFAERVISTGKESHLGARTVDLNSDGHLDIVSIAWDDYQYIHLWRSDPGVDATPQVTPTPQPTPIGAGGRITEGQQALYLFNESGGTTIHEVSGAGEAIPLKIDNPASVSWLAGGGILLQSPTFIHSEQAPSRLVEALRQTHEITLEAWIEPANTSQEGPARIVSLSYDSLQRNFTLGQEAGAYDMRLRTTGTSENGVPSLVTSSGAVGTVLSHVVYTRSAAGTTRFFLNGAEVGSVNTGGDFSNWNETYRLILGNEETRDRPWLGAIHLVAVYNRALSGAEVIQNYSAGPHFSFTGEQYLPNVINSKELGRLALIPSTSIEAPIPEAMVSGSLDDTAVPMADSTDAEYTQDETAAWLLGMAALSLVALPLLGFLFYLRGRKQLL
jgi:hypothetical protein